MTLIPLGSLIRQRRSELKLSQTQLGDRVGKSQRWISNLENGEIVQPRLPMLRSLADALETSVAELILAAGFAQSRDEAERLAIESAAFHIDADSPEGVLIPLIRRIDWDDRSLRSIQAMLREMAKMADPNYGKENS